MTAIGTKDRTLKLFALPGLGSVFELPVSYVRERAFANRKMGNRTNTPTNIQVSTLLMLIGG